MTPLRLFLFFLLMPASAFGVYAALRFGRHRCIHNDPLCRRDRPCIACYREIFEKAEERAEEKAAARLKPEEKAAPDVRSKRASNSR